MVHIKKKLLITYTALTFVLLFSLFISGVASAKTQAKDNLSSQVDYLALGDSLAFGLLSDGKTQSDGYAGTLAKDMKDIGFLASYSNQYTVPGYTTDDVLGDIQKNIRMGAIDTLGIQGHIAKADVITIDAGANDFFQELNITDEGIILDSSVNELIMHIGENMGKIVGVIKALNPTVQIYVMGYYNAFPYLPQSQQDIIKKVMDGINGVLNQVALSTGATFVPTEEAMAQNVKAYLPNPDPKSGGVHPSIEGYQVMANQLWDVIKPALTKNKENEFFINGKVVMFQQTPIMFHDHYLVPVRDIVAKLHGIASWDNSTRTVVMKKGTDVIKIQIDTMKAYKNNKQIKINDIPQMVEGHLMIPVRFATNVLGAHVKWDAAAENVFIGFN